MSFNFRTWLASFYIHFVVVYVVASQNISKVLWISPWRNQQQDIFIKYHKVVNWYKFNNIFHVSEKDIKWRCSWWCICEMRNVLDWISSWCWSSCSSMRCDAILSTTAWHRHDIKLNLKCSHSCVIRVAASVGKC